MRKKLATVALAGALGMTGVAGAVIAAPAVSYATTGDAPALGDRVAAIGEALAELVSDGTLTQPQADEVATTLAERGPFGSHGRGGGPGGGRAVLSAAAEALGLTDDELRTAAQEGTTLAELAEREGVSTSAVVDAMVTAAEAHLAEEVTEGDLTQDEADARAAELRTRITESVDEPLRAGHGPRHGHRHGPDEQGAVTAPSTSTEGDDA